MPKRGKATLQDAQTNNTIIRIYCNVYQSTGDSQAKGFIVMSIKALEIHKVEKVLIML